MGIYPISRIRRPDFRTTETFRCRIWVSGLKALRFDSPARSSAWSQGLDTLWPLGEPNLSNDYLGQNTTSRLAA